MAERKGTRGLELWCKRLVKDCPNVQIDNMTTSWRNGIAFCAMVHYFRPDLIDISTLKPENIYENNQLAFTIAEKELGIPSLLDPEDMVANEIPDRLSILTYLSQFYQRLGHTVNTKQADHDSTTPSPIAEGLSAPIQFGKTGLEKCVACGEPVYLAQRLMVSQKLYHRRCFRCTKCLGHMNPKNYAFLNGSDLTCDSCKNENNASKFLSSSSDQMGMLAFTDDVDCSYTRRDKVVSPTKKERPQSVLEKINMFEASDSKSTNLNNKLDRLSLNEKIEDKKRESLSNCDTKEENKESESLSSCDMAVSLSVANAKSDINKDNKDAPGVISDIPEVMYKSDLNKHIFLQTQLSGDIVTKDNSNNINNDKDLTKKEDCTKSSNKNLIENKSIPFFSKQDSNVTDDNRLAKSTENVTNSKCDPLEVTGNSEQEIKISVPPRRKKLNSSDKTPEKNKNLKQKESIEYPDNLNPFSDDEDEALDVKNVSKESAKRQSMNPFGSSDEEDDDVPPIPPLSKPPSAQGTPGKRVIAAPAYNPFWSDGEEPTSEDESHNESGSMYKSPLTTSTPNLPTSSHRRKKGRAPPPPPTIKISESPQVNNVSLDDVASISSVSSYNSTAHSEHKSLGKITPSSIKKRASGQIDSLSTASTYGGSMEAGVDVRSNSGDGVRKKGPAPGLPLPERREVKLQVTPQALQIQLDMLETQQLGLEKQGILIEQMIRTKCEGDEPVSVPQEEVEDLVIQLCEIVNEKNDLFRKQTELMYIRRQQRLEQEQADIEHEIRVIQSRPAVNRTDADKAREEQLVARLVEIVRMRDELVNQLDSERRRERQEDIAIATSIAVKRAQRSSGESNSSTIKSADVTIVKKNKVKDKMKKQLKKAKLTLISKKKDDLGKDQKVEKDKKIKDK